MTPTSNINQNGLHQHWVVVRAESTGKFAAQAVGIPHVAATAETREEAIDRVHELLEGLLACGQLVSIDVGRQIPAALWSGPVDPNDPHEQAYLDALARQRQLDLDTTIREIEQECSNTSSTPTT